MSFAKITVVGRAGKDGELQYLASGTAVLKFSLAANTGYKENKITTWYNCAYFGKGAEAVANYVTKGKQILVDGEPKLNQFTTKDGKTMANIEIRVAELRLLGGRDDNAATRQQMTTQTYDDSEVPF